MLKKKHLFDCAVARYIQAIVIMVAYVSLGVLAVAIMESWSFETALYYVALTVTTVGSDDLSPELTGTKVFLIIYGLVGIAIAATATALIALGMRDEENTCLDKIFKGVDLQVGRGFRKLLMSVFCLILVILVGMTFYGFANNIGTIDALYLAVMISTSVGYGAEIDFKISDSHACRVFTAIYAFIALVCLLLVFHSSAMLCVKYQSKRELDEVLSEGVTVSTFSAMDHDRDGEVTRDEFLAYLLIKLRKVDQSLIEKLNLLFDECDVNGNGLLDTNDCREYQSSKPKKAG